MSNLLKMERYQLFHNVIYRCGAAASLADIFNGMVYDSTFLLIFASGILALILGQEFSCRTIGLEISAGHSRKEVFAGKVISCVTAFDIMAIIYPIAGCIREYPRFGIAEPGLFFYHVLKDVLYSFLLDSAVFLLAVFFCCCLQNAVKSAAVTAGATFVLSLYLGYGMMLHLPCGMKNR